MAVSDERAARLKAQLRANLKRRKAPAVPDPDRRPTAIDPLSGATDADASD